MADGKRKAIRGDHAHVHDVRASVADAIHERRRKCRAGNPHVPPHNDAVYAQSGHQCAANLVGDLGVEFVRRHSPDVIGLEER